MREVGLLGYDWLHVWWCVSGRHRRYRWTRATRVKSGLGIQLEVGTGCMTGREYRREDVLLIHRFGKYGPFTVD